MQAHLVAAGKYHDIDFARLELLKLLDRTPGGVPIAELVRIAGGPPGSRVVVDSLERHRPKSTVDTGRPGQSQSTDLDLHPDELLPLQSE